MKKIKLMLIMVLGILLLAACAKDKKEAADTESEKLNQTPATTETPEMTKAPEVTSAPEVSAEKLTVNIAALKGPTAIGMVKLMDDAATGITTNDYKFSIEGTADAITAGMVKGDYDIAAVPCNMASVLYNKTEGGVRLAGINTLGVLYIVETGDTIKSVKDLKGKTIYATGLGTTPQYTLNYILNANGIDPNKDVTIEYKTEATEVASILERSKDAVAMLPQPYVTTVLMKNNKLRIALDIAKEWEAVSKDGSSVVTGVVIVKKDFLEKNKEAFDAFMKEYTASAAYVNEKIEASAALVEKYNIFKAEPMKKAIPLCNITLLQGDEMKQKVNGYLTALFQQDPKAVGGKLPEDEFYYIP